MIIKPLLVIFYLILRGWVNNMKNNLVTLLIVTVVLAGILTAISISLYELSGAAQLDLSRPGYRDVTHQVERSEKTDGYSSNGPVTEATINEFIDMYITQSEKAKSVDAFSGDPLNPEVLLFGASTEE